MVVRTGYSSRCNAKQSLLLHCFGVVTAVRAGAGHYPSTLQRQATSSAPLLRRCHVGQNQPEPSSRRQAHIIIHHLSSVSQLSQFTHSRFRHRAPLVNFRIQAPPALPRSSLPRWRRGQLHCIATTFTRICERQQLIVDW